MAVKVFRSVTHLGHVLHDNIYKHDASKCVGDFNKQCNIFFANSRYATSSFRSFLFGTFCTSFYGSQLLPLYDDCMGVLFRAWRVAIRRVWRVPWRTHCSLLPHLAGVMSPELLFSKRTLKFVLMGLENENENVMTLLRMGVQGSYSLFGANCRSLDYKFNLSIKNIFEKWNYVISTEENTIKKADMIIDLCRMRDRNYGEFLSINECKDLINYLCLD